MKNADLVVDVKAWYNSGPEGKATQKNFQRKVTTQSRGKSTPQFLKIFSLGFICLFI